MQASTIATLEALEAASWFSRVGVKDSGAGVFLSSWPEAIEYARSYEWECVCNQAFNQYRAELAARSKERWLLWNDIVVEVKKFTEPLVERKIAAVVRENNLPIEFEYNVRSAIAALCIGSEYEDVCPRSFFAAYGYWYIEGHFPCGWLGTFPSDGKLVIY